MHWYFPSWNGDIRIESDEEDPGRTVLTVIEPTAHELLVLENANNVFRAKKWVNQGTKLWKLGGDQERQQTVVNASLLQVGLILMGRLKPGIATLTAITTEQGVVEAMGSSEPGFLAWVGKSLQGDVGATPRMVNFRDEEGYVKLQVAKREEAKRRADAEAAAEKRRKEDAALAARIEIEEKQRREQEAKREADRQAEEKRRSEEKAAAASVKRPTTCCPDSVPGVVGPAQEVLLAFCTPEQREQWLKERRLVANGGLTGHRYLIAHRNTPTAVKISKCTYDLDDQAVMHFHDWTVPPEEEVLAAKLILEHREPWLRNEATCLGNHTQVFRNPFGDGRDGTHDAELTRQIGHELRMMNDPQYRSRFARS